jgi:hypothetical protein
MALDPETIKNQLVCKTNIDIVAQFKRQRDIAPSVAAAIGNLKLLVTCIRKPADLYEASTEFFPNAIQAAVAADQTKILTAILAYLRANVKGKPHVKSWDQMRAAARYISQALRVAVRLNKTDIGNQIFDFFADNPLYTQSTSLYFAGQLVNDCMRYGNMDLIKGAFVYQENGCYHSSDKDQTLDFTISADDEEFLFKHGTLNAFRALIKTRLFNPNAGKFHRVPLEHALARRKYKIA